MSTATFTYTGTEEEVLALKRFATKIKQNKPNLNSKTALKNVVLKIHKKKVTDLDSVYDLSNLPIRKATTTFNTPNWKKIGERVDLS
jgi:TPP-dependent 2-oxoacid decarboxylase